MLDPDEFLAILKANQVNFFAGVPDSLLKNLLSRAAETLEKSHYHVCANEGSAVGLAAGHFLATGEIACVYMQNSGLGNAINPLLSMADPLVFALPILLVIGYRGEPGVKDEPQHLKQGAVSERLLEAMDIPFEILDANLDPRKVIEKAIRSCKSRTGPSAILVRKDTFESKEKTSPSKSIGVERALSRETAIRTVAAEAGPAARFVASTGKIARELYEYRHAAGQSHATDFYCVGGMGHASQIALGISLSVPEAAIFCLDGDGAALMHLGHLAAIAASAPSNFTHIILNNQVHESVGGQPTVNPSTDFAGLGSVLKYKHSISVDSEESLKEALNFLKDKSGPSLLEVLVNVGSREDLVRPKKTPSEMKEEFMHRLQGGRYDA